jgi:hypothetical protein
MMAKRLESDYAAISRQLLDGSVAIAERLWCDSAVSKKRFAAIVKRYRSDCEAICSDC